MKIQSLFQKLGSALALTMVVAGLAHAPNVSAAGLGGVGDGGGNAIPEDAVSEGLIQDWLSHAKEPTRYALHQLEMTLGMLRKDKSQQVYQVDYNALYQKLFEGKKTVYQALDEAVFAPILVGGCEGIDTPLDKDANSLKNAPNICFSLENLSYKLHEFSGKPQLIALIAHEVSHMVGATEDEAVMIQNMIQSSVSSSAFDSASELGQSFRANLSTAIDDAKTELGSPKKYCESVQFNAMTSTTMQLMNTVSDNISQLGMIVPTQQGLGHLYATLIKSVNLLNACAGRESDPRIVALFKDRKQVTVRQYGTALGYTDWDQYPDVIVRRVNPKDEKTVRQELKDVLDQLVAVQSASQQ